MSSLQRINLVKRELITFIQRGLDSNFEHEQIQNSTEMFNYINNNFELISHPSFNTQTNILDTIIIKMSDFRRSIIKKMDINYGFGRYNHSYKNLMDVLDNFENKLKIIGIILEPLNSSFDINEVIVVNENENLGFNINNAPPPHLSIRNPFLR